MSETTVTRVEKPWGYELHWARTPRYVGKIRLCWHGSVLHENVVQVALASRLNSDVRRQRKAQFFFIHPRP